MSSGKAIVAFAAVPSVGLSIAYDGQVFEMVRSEPYTRKDGGQSALLTWRTNCRSCGEVVEYKTGCEFRVSRRNCDEHKWGGPHA